MQCHSDSPTYAKAGPHKCTMCPCAWFMRCSPKVLLGPLRMPWDQQQRSDKFSTSSVCWVQVWQRSIIGMCCSSSGLGTGCFGPASRAPRSRSQQALKAVVGNLSPHCCLLVAELAGDSSAVAEEAVCVALCEWCLWSRWYVSAGSSRRSREGSRSTGCSCSTDVGVGQR